jgi:hypothetical protein
MGQQGISFKTIMMSCRDINIPACIGFFGRCITNRNNPISAELPKEAKIRRGANITLRHH